MKKIYNVLLAGLLSLLPVNVSAHEAYVVSKEFFWEELGKKANPHSINALWDPHNFIVATQVAGGIFLLVILNFLFRRSQWGLAFHNFIERAAPVGPIVIRITIALSLLIGSQTGAFLGPELRLEQLPFPEVFRFLISLTSIMLLFGFLTEIAAVIGLLLIGIGFFYFGAYLLTYLSFVGVLLSYLLFGARHWSCDVMLYGPVKKWRAKWKPFKSTVVRVSYGLSLIFTGIMVKFMHPDISLRVVNEWNLTQFTWLFPSDPLLLVLGAGIVEIVIGFFVLVGFEMRMTALISLFYFTLSLFYFQELIWPHLLLYGVTFGLMIQPETFSLDHLFFKQPKKT